MLSTFFWEFMMPSGSMSTFPERLRAARKQKDMTQEALAEALGVERGAIQRWELDQRTPRVDILPKLSEVLGVPMDWFFGEEPLDPEDPFYRPSEEELEKERVKNIEWVKAGFPAAVPADPAALLDRIEKAERRAEERHQEMLAALRLVASQSTVEDEKAAALKRIRTTMAGTPTVNPSARPQIVMPERGAARTKKELPKNKNE